MIYTFKPGTVLNSDESTVTTFVYKTILHKEQSLPWGVPHTLKAPKSKLWPLLLARERPPLVNTTFCSKSNKYLTFHYWSVCTYCTRKISDEATVTTFVKTILHVIGVLRTCVDSKTIWMYAAPVWKGTEMNELRMFVDGVKNYVLFICWHRWYVR